ncbi:MAG TPA: MmcQ/YjbR family DNA-binding protein [Streptosporangiaceae bacterium]|nr:MmcQ/YjbR family DNA-binding protein [Streptosporangiaceae bacterium]
MADEGGDRDHRVTIEDVRAWALALPRTEEHLIRDYVKFRVGRIVYAAVSPDETILGFGFPKEERAALIAAEPERFLLDRTSDARYNWIDARIATLDAGEAHEFIIDAWRMVVPKRLAAQVAEGQTRGTQST